MPTTTHFSNLPSEVTELIGSLLDPNDLTQCVLVNSTWHSLFIPSLWRTLRITDESRSPCLLTRDFWRAFDLNKDLIRVFETNDPNFTVVAVHQLTKLQSLTYCPSTTTTTTEGLLDVPLVLQYIDLNRLAPLRPEQVEDLETFDNPMIIHTLISKNRNLRSLSINEPCFRLGNGEDVFHKIIVSSLLMLSSLERLVISFDKYNMSLGHEQPPFDDELYMFLPEIYSEHVDNPPELGEGERYVYSESLKEVSISGGNSEIDPYRLLFLDKCKQLETIRLACLDECALVSIPLALQILCPTVTHLDWRKGSKEESDESLGLLLFGSRAGWKRLDLPDMREFGPTAFQALMRSAAETLEVLSVEGWGKLEHEQFLELLCTASRLRRLEGASDRCLRSDMRVFEVDAYRAFDKHAVEGVDRSWALGASMEFLQMRISGVPRPDVVRRHRRIQQQLPKTEGEGKREGEGEGEGEGATKEAEQRQQVAARRYDVQRWIYTQLSRMTGLCELVLGTADMNQKDVIRRLESPSLGRGPFDVGSTTKGMIECYNFSSLEFSIESGLGLLAELKEMRMLDVRMTAHRIGVAELEWMHVNWPKLREVKGLTEERMWAGDDDGDKDGVTVKEVEAWLAAHPHGIGSSYV